MRCHHAIPPSRPTERRVRQTALAAALAGLLLAPHPARAQTSPLTLVPSNGRVGIGTTTPSELLHVLAGTGDAGVRISSNNGYTNSILRVVNETGGLQIQTGAGTYIMTFNNSLSRVGIMTNNPQATLDVSGTVSASVKAFRIPHPVDPTSKDLVHASLEGPEIGVYYRGEAQLAQGQAVVTLPPYFEGLTNPTGRTVQLTPVGGWAPLYVVSAVQAGQFTVRVGTGGNPSQRFYWEVKAVRRDVPALTLEPPKRVEPPQPPPLPLPPGGR